MKSFYFLEKTGEVVVFTVENHPAIGYGVYYDWQFGSEAMLENATETTANHTFQNPGNHVVRLHARNAISCATHEVYINTITTCPNVDWAIPASITVFSIFEFFFQILL